MEKGEIMKALRLLVVALIVYLFLMRRYDFKYVYDYSSADL